MFVGQSRREIVDRLEAAFDEVQEGSGSVVAVLVSQPGWGKTRIVQELYQRLSARQSQPGYWPASILGEDVVALEDRTLSALSHARKAVYPTKVTVQAGASMDWMWWGVLCHQRATGQLAQAMFEDATQLYAHAEALMRDPIDNAGNRAVDVSAALIGVLGLFGFAVAPPVGAAIAIVGAASVGWENLDVVRRLRDWRSDSRDKHQDRNIVADSDDHRNADIERLIEGLGRVTRDRPLILVVDDAHFADSTLVRVVDGLVRESRGRVLLVASAWPSHLDRLDDSLPFAAWLRGFAAEGSRRYLRFDLEELADTDVKEVVRAELPAAEDFARTLQELYGTNLLAIQAVLRLPRIRTLAERGRLDVSAVAKLELPRDIEAAFSEHWAGLPDDVQRALALAGQPQGGRYLPELVATVCEAEGIIESARARIAEGISPYAWAREIDQSLHMFIEPVLHDIARNRAGELLIDEEIEALYSAIVRAARDVEDDRRSPAARNELLEEHVALVESGFAPGDEGAATSAIVLAALHAARYDYARAIELARFAIAWSGLAPEDPVLFETREQIAEWLADAGRLSESSNEREALVGDRTLALGPDHPDTLRARSLFASALGYAGRSNEAADAFEALVADETRVLGRDHVETLRVRRGLAYWLSWTRRTDLAVTQLETLVTDQTSLLGADHQDTLFSRYDLAICLAWTDQTDRTEDHFRALLDDQERVLGAGDPETLETRSAFANWLVTAGDPAQAIDQFESLIRDEARVLGADHMTTLRTRSSLGRALMSAGRTDEGIEQLEMLVADRTSVFGADSPETLGERVNLAFWLGSTNRTDEALRQFETVVADQTRVVGPDNITTLRARHQRAAALTSAGRYDEAVEQLETLVADATRVFGADYPDILRFRDVLAFALNSAGRHGEAADQSRTLATDRSRIFGPDDPETLSARSRLAFSLGMADRTDEAVDVFEALVADQTRVLGADHVDTLRTRHQHAVALTSAGRYDEAVDQLETLVADATRVFGADYPDTLLVRDVLAFALNSAGRHGEAADQSRTLATDRSRIFGPDDPETLSARSRLAFSLGMADRTDEAVGVLEALVVDQTRVLGTDHPDTVQTRSRLASLLGLAQD